MVITIIERQVNVADKWRTSVMSHIYLEDQNEFSFNGKCYKVPINRRNLSKM